MNTRRLAVLIFAVFVGASATAEQVGPSVRSDLNGDGQAEVFALFAGAEGTVDLQITGTGSRPIYVPQIAWRGGIGQQPDLTLAANGSVRLTSRNDAIGRNRWSQTLTLAFRSGAYRVAGFTYSWYDTLNLADTGVCDLNLLTRRGVLEVNESRREVRTKLSAVPVTNWSESTPIPAACGF